MSSYLNGCLTRTRHKGVSFRRTGHSRFRGDDGIPILAQSPRLVTCSYLLCALIVSGCEFFEKQRQPIGYSTDENGRPCATYEIKKDVVYETRCDYRATDVTVPRNPLSKQEAAK